MWRTVFVVMFGLAIVGCSDAGDGSTQPPPGGGGGGLTAQPSTVTVSNGVTVNVQISGGTTPYVIDDPPNSSLATAMFVNPNVTPAVLNITGVSTASGTTSVKVKDSTPSPEREVRVTIIKN